MAKKKRSSDWRVDAQNERTRKNMDILASVVQTLCGLVCLGLLLTDRSKVLIAADVLLMLLCMGLYLAFPGYFTLLDEEQYEKRGGKAKVRSISLPLIFCLLGLLFEDGYGITADTAFSFLGWYVAIGVLVGFLVYRFSRECREEFDYTCWIALGTAAVLFIGFPAMNYLLSSGQMESAQLEVESLRERDSRGPTRYYAEVVTGDGETLLIRVPLETYERLSLGDPLTVQVGESWFGVDFGLYQEP